MGVRDYAKQAGFNYPVDLERGAAPRGGARAAGDDGLWAFVADLGRNLG